MAKLEIINNELFPFIPIRGIVLFPGMITPLIVGREKSIKSIEQAMLSGAKEVVFATQIDSLTHDPDLDSLYDIGVIGNVMQVLKTSDGNIKVLVDVVSRVKLLEIHDKEGFSVARVETLESFIQQEQNISVQTRNLREKFSHYLHLTKRIPIDLITLVDNIDDAENLTDLIAAQLTLKIAQKQDLLNELDIEKRVEILTKIILEEINYIQLNQKINSRIKNQIDKNQREYYLNEQLKAIQKELGEDENSQNEYDKLDSQIKKSKMSKEAEEKAKNDLKKLRNLGNMSGEAGVIRSYLECLVNLPWNKFSTINKDINKAQKVLDDDHWGLEKVKDRVVEYLSVYKRTENFKSPIMCFIGPPGVGKTSLAKSIAKATGREYVKISLGGVHDEAEIRGHRRSYIGALPGKIIAALKRVKVKNPLILFDEIDKIGRDYRGDPSAALLEVLDPEQNKNFVDHYLEIEFDLSKVFFIATANSYDIQAPLLDRMEVIRLSGYTEEEKLNIAIKHLLPKILKDHAVKEGEIEIDENVILKVIRDYTREAGVRNLEREIAKIIRKSLTKIIKKDAIKIEVTQDNLKSFLGVKKYQYNVKELVKTPGIATGLAYTEAGGDILHIEVLPVHGKGNIKLTGKLGQVMQESAYTAFSYVKFQEKYHIKKAKYEESDIHIHVPEGAVPKDGPSAGIALVTAIVSAFTNIPVRNDVAMTGEVTLRGKVLPIGGLKEKLLAAIRSGITTVIIPEENRKDLEELPPVIAKSLEIKCVSHVDEVIEIALESLPITDNMDKGQKKISKLKANSKKLKDNEGV